MPTPNQDDPLPDYERPPVVETVLGVLFDPITNFGNAQLGAFWKDLDPKEWVSVTDAPALPAQFEQFGSAVGRQAQFNIQLTQALRTRLQIKNAADDLMIQIQHGAVRFNWLGNEGVGYRRYPAVREGFKNVLEQFADFVKREKIGELRPNQWEVTYVNNIPKGTVWNKPSDWSFFQPLAAVPSLPGLAEGESFSGEWHFVIPEQRGRLHVNWRHGLAPPTTHEARETIWLTLTARGPITTGDDVMQAVLDGIDLGRTTIVKSFRALMTDRANQYWGLKT